MPFGRTRARDRSRGKGGGANNVLASFDLVNSVTQSGGAVSSLPTGLSFARADASTCATVQISASTNSATIAANVARYGNDGARSGLVIEPTRKQQLTYSNDYSQAFWAVNTGGGATRTGSQSDPAGGTTAHRIAGPSGVYHLGENLVTGDAGVAWTGSYWAKASSGTQTPNGSMLRTAAGTRTATSASVSTSFSRIAFSQTGASNTESLVLVDGRDWSANSGVAAGARDVIVWGAQREIGAYATELIQTSGAVATRAGERLYLASAAPYVNGGRLSIALSFYAKCSPSQADGAMRFWTSGSDYAEISTAGTLTVSIGGSTNTCSASWSQFDLVDIYIAAGGSAATIVSVRTNGGATSFPTITGSALGNVSTGGALDLLCNSTSNQLAGWHRSITFYRS